MNLTDLSDDELIRSLKSLVGRERGGLVAILKHLAEFEKRRLAVKTGFPSLFDYCVRELRYAQGESLRRIRAARAADKYKILYRLLERGVLSLTTVALLEPYLKWDNYRKLIRASIGRSTREVEALVASLSSVPAAPVERIRFLSIEPAAPPAEVADLFTQPVESASAPVESASAPIECEPSPVAASVPPAVRRVHFSFTGDEALLRDVERAKELSRHKWPAGKLEEVFAGAIQALLEKIDPERRNRKRQGRMSATRARRRNIPRAVKDEVWRRDEGRCAFKSNGRSCGARSNLEFDHVRPWALGGDSNEPANIRLLCRAHNDSEARRAFGGGVIDAVVDRRRRALRRGANI